MDERIASVEREPKTKSMIEFDTEYACSIKALGVKENNQIKPTTRFFSGKMLMFAKLSLKSFICDLIETFVFPNAATKEIYNKNEIEYVYIYQILTYTDSAALQFLFICSEKSTKNDREYRDEIFGVISSNDIFKRFDTSHKFWEKFEARDEKTRKKLGLFEIEDIDDPCEITIAVNLKEYIEKLSSDEINKKHKGLRKGADGMGMANYDRRINSVRNIERFGKVQNEHLSQHRFLVKHNEMHLQELKRCKFAQINDKRYYFEDGIVSLPF